LACRNEIHGMGSGNEIQPIDICVSPWKIPPIENGPHLMALLHLWHLQEWKQWPSISARADRCMSQRCLQSNANCMSPCHLEWRGWGLDSKFVLLDSAKALLAYYLAYHHTVFSALLFSLPCHSNWLAETQRSRALTMLLLPSYCCCPHNVAASQCWSRREDVNNESLIELVMQLWKC
jgi:hypothetical protein